MKFSANKSELLPIAQRIRRVIGNRFVSRELCCVHMSADAEKNTVVFTGMGSDCTLQIRHNCPVEESGQALLFASIWLEILQHFVDEATFVATDKKSLSLRNAKSVYDFALMDVTKYPKQPQLEPKQLLDCANLPEIASKVLFSVARGHDCKEQLRCVHLTVHDGQFSAESCDGCRLTIAHNAAAQDEPMDLLITESSMKTLLDVLRGIPTCKIGTSGQQVLVLAPNMIFHTNISSYKFLNLQSIIQNVKPITSVEVDGSMLCDTLARLGAGNTLGACVVVRSPQKDVLNLLYASNNKTNIQAQIDMTANVQNPLPAEGFCYNYAYLLEAARLIKDKAVNLQFDPQGFLMMETDTELHILLPRKLPKDVMQTKPKRKGRKKAA